MITTSRTTNRSARSASRNCLRLPTALIEINFCSSTFGWWTSSRAFFHRDALLCHLLIKALLKKITAVLQCVFSRARISSKKRYRENGVYALHLRKLRWKRREIIHTCVCVLLFISELKVNPWIYYLLKKL